MEQAIKQAIKGGWVHQPPLMMANETGRAYCLESIFDDPLFWQALGKAEGWVNNDLSSITVGNWFHHWHCFISHLADGGTPDEFFEKLLTKQN